jgi:hypothetical protein
LLCKCWSVPGHLITKERLGTLQSGLSYIAARLVDDGLENTSLVSSNAASRSEILTVRGLLLLHAGDADDARSAAAKTREAASANSAGSSIVGVEFLQRTYSENDKIKATPTCAAPHRFDAIRFDATDIHCCGALLCVCLSGEGQLEVCAAQLSGGCIARRRSLRGQRRACDTL